MADSNLISFILFLPFFAFIFCQLFTKKYKNWVGIFFCTVVFFALILSVLFYYNNSSLPKKVINFYWFSVSNKQFLLSFLLDKYTFQMLILVNFIGLLVGLFSIEYMRNDPAKHRYFGFIGLFLFSMVGIILSGNLFQMYFFWELVGFSSYLLIGFWYTKPEAIAASKKAFLMNKIGDMSLLIGIFLCFQHFGSTQITSLTSFGQNSDDLTIIGLLLFGGCIAKSAQFPLHTWLPDAMEGPTPISALIHAATMVAAGIYLIIKVFPIFTPSALIWISTIGCISMLMAGVKAILQSDIKKVLAYSTISQLGLMVLAVGAASPNSAFYHLLTHAFFKAGLFLSAGSVIYSVHNASPTIDAQNMYLMGGLRKKLPITFISYIICTAAMIGLPLFSGFISKDQIIEIWYHKAGLFSQVMFISLLISSVLSALYMGRQIWLIFGASSKMEASVTDNLMEDSLWIKSTIIILAICSTFLIAFVFHIPFPAINSLSVITTILALVGLIAIYFLRGKLMITYHYQSIIDAFYENQIAKNMVRLANQISAFDRIIFDGFTILATNITIIFSNLIKWLDYTLIDGFVNSIVKITARTGKYFTRIQSGQFQWYISAMIVILLLLFVFSGGI